MEEVVWDLRLLVSNSLDSLWMWCGTGRDGAGLRALLNIPRQRALLAAKVLPDSLSNLPDSVKNEGR